MFENCVAIQNTMLDLMKAASQDGNTDVAVLAGRLQTQFMQGRYLGLRYVLTRQLEDSDEYQEEAVAKVDAE